MKLDGSCHCKAVRFSVKAQSYLPFNRCYCEICRKTAGAGGFAINLGADFTTLQVTGRDQIRTYRAQIEEDGETVLSPAERSFCGICGSQLWLWDPRWPDLVHPHASAIDTDLPAPPMRWHMMLGSRASWACPDLAEGDRPSDTYPDQSLADWHQALGHAFQPTSPQATSSQAANPQATIPQADGSGMDGSGADSSDGG